MSKEIKPPVSSGNNTRDEKGRFKTGISGNPEGRPEGTLSITSEIKKKLQECPKGENKTYLQLLIVKILKKATEDGDQQMITKIWNYVDGLPKEKIEQDINFREQIEETSESIRKLIEKTRNENKD